jgi:hypothetical protein
MSLRDIKYIEQLFLPTSRPCRNDCKCEVLNLEEKLNNDSFSS